MAYQARQRDPLFDDTTQAMIERRGTELLGIALMGAALALALMLGSYVPEDPSWLSATDAPAENMLGRFGASIAGPLFLIVGWAAWAIVLCLAGWGLRMVLHVGSERVWSRAIFAPLAVALVSIYASTHVPAGDWTHSFGLGGLFGDTVLGAILSFLPASPALGLKLIAVASAVAALVMMLYILAFSMIEMRLTLAFLAGGVVMLYAGLATGLAKGTATGLSLLGQAGAGLGGAAAVRSAARLNAAGHAPPPGPSTRPSWRSSTRPRCASLPKRPSAPATVCR